MSVFSFKSQFKLLYLFSKQLHLPKSVRFTSTNQLEQVQPLRPKKSKSNRDVPQKFVDWRRVTCQGGTGGNGECVFARIFCNPQAGPSGGDGGNGGHVIFKSNPNVSSLLHLASIQKAPDGEKGYPKDCHGKNANDLVIEVPIGTTFKDLDGNVVMDLNTDTSYFVAARGGAGGKGNHFFLSNENRAPEVSEIGAEGEIKVYDIVLNTIAHVGLIGFPNAGKSTLLRAISRAKPKVAAYPFTTLKPHIGAVHFDDYSQLLVADIPGLIPGAHNNKGLGFQFLRHIERCVCLVYIIDLSLPEPSTQLEVLKYELEKYQPGLSQRPHAVVGNKVDLEGAEESLEELRKNSSIPVYPISAKKGNNVKILIKHLREIYDLQTKYQNNLQHRIFCPDFTYTTLATFQTTKINSNSI